MVGQKSGVPSLGVGIKWSGLAIDVRTTGTCEQNTDAGELVIAVDHDVTTDDLAEDPDAIGEIDEKVFWSSGKSLVIEAGLGHEVHMFSDSNRYGVLT